MQTEMINYYRQRAGEYEQVYAKAERQADLRRFGKIVEAAFRDQDVLGVACGTGYWTEAFVAGARSVLACDISPEVLEIARSKDWEANSIEFIQADAFALPELDRQLPVGK